jgi:hypothetical protein
VTIKERLTHWLIYRTAKRKGRKDMRNIKTTIMGYLAGLTGGTAAGWTKPDGSINWFAVAFAIVSAVFGHMAKDHDQTGTGK